MGLIIEYPQNKLHSSHEEKEVIMKCMIGPVEMEKLSATLKEVPVKELNLSTHKIGDEGAIYLGKAISEIVFLEELIMRNCNIREDGIVALALALRANKTLKKLDLYTHNKISQRSEIELTKTLLQNTTLLNLCVNQNLELTPPSLHGSHTIHTFRVTAASMSTLLKDTSTSVFYAGIKNSPIIASIEIDSTTSLGQALWAGNMEEAAEILQLHQPPVVDKTLIIHMIGNTWTVNYRIKCVLEDDKELVRVRSICNNPESWSQLKELKIQFKGSVGACILAKTLNKMQLQKLEINDSGKEEEGIVALCQALSANTTLKSLILHSSVGYRDPISRRSEEALTRALLQNTTLTTLHVNYPKYEGKPFHFNLSTLKDVSDIELYSGIKQSPIIACIEIDSATPLGQALWAGNMEEAAEIVQLHQPPVVDKTLTIHMIGNTWTVNYRTKCVLEDDKELVRVRSICNNPESWSQLKELKLQFKGSVGACILAKTLNKMQLQKLEINDSGEEEEGIVAICQALSANTTLKSLILHSSVGPRDPISRRSEEALTRALLQNTTLTTLHVNYPKYEGKPFHFNLSTLKDVSDIELYSGIKQSPIIACIEIDSATPLGQALWAGNMEEAAEILQLHQPPVVGKRLIIHMIGNTWTVNYRTKCVLEDDKELVRVRSICNNPESWSQLKELKLRFEGSVGACILAKTLNKVQLQKLEIDDSGEEEEGIVAICQALSANTTLKSLILHSSVGPRDPISRRSEEALVRALLKNTTLTTLHVNYLKYEGKTFHFNLSTLKDVSDIELYSGIKQSPIIACIEIDSATPLGQALWAGNMEEAAEILQLHQPPVVGKRLIIHMIGNTWTVNYRTKCVLEDDKELVRVRSICNNPESWSQLKELKLRFEGSVGACILAKTLNKVQLQKLEIDDSGEEEEGIVAICQALSANTTLKSLILHSSVGPRDPISRRSEEALVRALLKNTTLTTLHVNYLKYEGKTFHFNLSTLKDISDIELYSGIKQSPIISHIEIDSATSLGQALWAGNMEEAAEILQLHQPPVVDKTLTIHMSGNTWTVNYRTKCVLEDDKELVRVRSICNNPESWSQLKELKLQFKGSVGACILAKTMNKMQLQKLEINDSGEEEEGIVAICQALSGNTTLKSLILHYSVTTRFTLRERSEKAIVRALLQNTTLTSLHVNYSKYRVKRMKFNGNILKDVCTFEIYSGIKQSSIIACIEIDSTTSLGQALWAGNMEEAAEILQLHQPPVVDKTLIIHMSGNTWTVNYRTKCVLEDDKELVRVRSICNNPESWSQLKELKLRFEGSVGACILAKTLNKVQLQKLEIDDSGEEEEGIVAICQALSANTTLKSLILHSSVGPRDPISRRSEEALVRALLKNTTLTTLHVNYLKYEGKTFHFNLSTLKDISDIELYSGIKQSPIISHIEIDSATSLGQALWAGNMEEAAEILQLHQPPVVDKTLTIHMSGNTWTVNYRTKCVLEDDKELVRVRSICNNPESWSQLKELKLQFKGSVGACILAKTMNKMQLQKLEINDSGEEEEGIVAICQALSGNTTLKSLILHYSVTTRFTLRERSEKAIVRALLQNTTLTSLHVNYSKYRVKRMKFNGNILKDVCTFEIYSGIKQSSIIACIEIDSTTSLGQALWAGNMEEAAEILQLHQPPVVDKTLIIHMSGNTWTVNYRTKCVLEDDEELVRVRSICNNPESWSQLKELKLKFKGSVGACILAKTLNKMQLQKLEIDDSGEEEEGIVAICQALSGNTTLKSFILVGYRYCINGSSEDVLTNSLLKNANLNIKNYCLNYKVNWMNGSILKDVRDIELYSGIKQSPIISQIRIASTTSLGQALWAGNMEEAAEILQLHQPPVVDKKLTIHMSVNTWPVTYSNIWMVDYRTKCVLEIKFHTFWPD